MDSGHADRKESGEKTKRARLNELEGRIGRWPIGRCRRASDISNL